MKVKDMYSCDDVKRPCKTVPEVKKQEDDWSDILKDIQPKFIPGDPVAVFRDAEKNDGFQTEVVSSVHIELSFGMEGPQKIVKYVMEDDYSDEFMDEEEVWDVSDKITEPEDEC